jgi:hypothetical protein
MPIPTPKSDETQKDFVQRCMNDNVIISEYPGTYQRYAICINQFKTK